MKLDEVLPALRAGKKIRQANDDVYYVRKGECIGCYYIDDYPCPFDSLRTNMLDEDWEVME